MSNTPCGRCTKWGHSSSSCPLNRKRWAPIAITLAVTVLFGGCGTSGWIPPDPPSSKLMEAPKPPPLVKPGDDLVLTHLKLRKQYLKETALRRSLQNYVRVSRGEGAK